MAAINRLLHAFYRDYEYVATRIGVTGNALFVVGSILFLTGPRTVSTVFWLLGSVGMLVRALGRLYVDDRQAAIRYQGRDGGEAMTRARQELETAPE